ncbi:MAG: DUF3179 domain-containing protein [Anaerolineales bacterium]
MTLRMILWIALAAGTLFLSACAPQGAASPSGEAVNGRPAGVQTPLSTGAPAQSESAPQESAGTPPTPKPTLNPGERPPSGASSEFSTDFSIHSVPYSEILSGGPPKDGIPAIDAPKFVAVAQADAWLEDREPVIFFQLGADARAYPLQIFMWHEIVNDVVNGTPVVVTFCPLCNTAIAFERTVDGQVLDFGTTGRLRFSNLVMYDRQTETWWQQATGEAIIGALTGTRLKPLPAAIIAWGAFKESHPDGQVLSRETGFVRSYGHNPYAGYDDIASSPFLYRGPSTPGTLPPMARVLTVDLNGEAVAYPYEVLAQVGAVNDTVGGQPVVVLWQAGTASALDNGSVAGGRDVGSAAAYRRVVDGQTLTFAPQGEGFTDAETGSSWSVLGEALAGPLAGRHLEAVVSINHFWFSWAAFRPETRVYTLP